MLFIWLWAQVLMKQLKTEYLDIFSNDNNIFINNIDILFRLPL